MVSIPTYTSTIPKSHREVLWYILLGELFTELQASIGTAGLYEYAEQQLQLEHSYVKSYMRMSNRFADRAEEVKSIPMAGLRALAGEQLTDEEANAILEDVLAGNVEKRSLNITRLAFRLTSEVEVSPPVETPTVLAEVQSVLAETQQVPVVDEVIVSEEIMPEVEREINLTSGDDTVWEEFESRDVEVERVDPPVVDEQPLLPSLRILSYRVQAPTGSVEDELRVALQTIAGRLHRWSKLLSEEAAYVERVLTKVVR